MYKNNHRRNSLCSMDWTETKFEYLGLELFGQCKTCEYDWKCCRWSFRKGCNWKLFSYTSAANGLVQSEFQPKIYPELSCCVCVIINMKLPRFTRNYNGWSRSFNGGDKMLSHAVAQIESRSLWRRHQRGCTGHSLWGGRHYDSILLLLQITQSPPVWIGSCGLGTTCCCCCCSPWCSTSSSSSPPCCCCCCCCSPSSSSLTRFASFCSPASSPSASSNGLFDARGASAAAGDSVS